MKESYDIVSYHLGKCLRFGKAEPGGVDFDADLKRHYGLTSLNLILLVTAVCDEAAIDLSNFTEDDIARLRTPRDIVTMLDSTVRRGA